VDFYIAKYKGIEEREFECEIVTPMFLHGADPQRAELRVPSIKGALRFWWRAIYGSCNIQKMYEEESGLFGNTSTKSCVKICIIENNLSSPSQDKISKTTFNIYEYLAYGYRVKDTIKQHIDKGSFKIRVSYPKSQEGEISNALQCLFSYSGLGSKSRNGFGSIQCKDQNMTVLNFNDLPFTKELKPFTAFSENARLFISNKKHTTWQNALSEIGEAYKNAKFELKQSNKDRSLIGKPFKTDTSRHSKPYFMHIHRTGDTTYSGSILYLPYDYHIENKRNDYHAACDIMNRCIKSSLGGNL